MALKDLFNKSNKRMNQESDYPLSDSNERNYNENPDSPSPVVVIYQSELDYISRCILDYTDIETGGQLFGFWTSRGTPVVVYTIGPGKNAQHNPTSFVQDQNYLQTIGLELHRRYRLQHIGEWHSHHQLGLTHPSGGDINTMQYGVGKPGFPRLLLCIGNCTQTHTSVNAFNFHENSPREYVHASWDIVNMESPYRCIIDIHLLRLLIQPITKHASHGQLRTIHNAVRERDSIRVHWLTENADNVETMKTFVSMIQSMFPDYSVKAEIVPSGEPQIAIKGIDTNVRIPYGFPRKGPILVNDSGEIINVSGVDNSWTIEEEQLPITFGKWASKNLQNFIQSHQQTQEDDLSIIETVAPRVLAKEEDKEYAQAEKRTKRLGMENQILSEYFHPNAFLWSRITDEPILNLVAFPFRKGNQAVIRMIIPGEFPVVAPKIQFGFYPENSTSQPTLPEHLANIQYRNLSDLFVNAGYVYGTMLNWKNDNSLFKAYIVSCIILHYYLKSVSEGKDASEYLYPLLDDEQAISKLTKYISQKIIENKQSY